MNKERFAKSIKLVTECKEAEGTIGTLGEKTLHKVLKYYVDENPCNHEVPVGRYVADVLNEAGITEIQTRGFTGVEKKIGSLLEDGKVKLIFPICAKKTVAWVDLQTGEVSGKRKSPQRGNLTHALPELYKIRRLLEHPNLTIGIILIEAEDYRYLNGWSKDKKKGSSRMERIPKELVDEYDICTIKDLFALLPETLHGNFTSDVFAKCSRLPISKARASLTLLSSLGIVQVVGKEGRKNLYHRVEKL